MIKPKILLHIHIYYHNQIDYIIKKLKNIKDFDYRLYVTIAQENEKTVAQLKAIKQDVVIIKTENLGYDIWPFVYVLNQVNLSEFDYILKLHTKNFRTNKNDRFGYGYFWRNTLYDCLIGSKKIFSDNLRLIKSPKIGMVGAKKYLYSTLDMPFYDLEYFENICKKLKIPSQGNFIGGTMFLAKAEIFQKIKNLNLALTNFEESGETNSNDNLAHCLERIFGILTENSCCKIIGVNDKFWFNKIGIYKILYSLFSIKRISNVKKQICIFGIKITYKSEK